MRYSFIVNVLLFCIPCFFFASCWKFSFNNNYSNNSDDLNTVRAEAYVPVYSNDSANSRMIQAGPARAIIQGGKIYVQGDLLFQVEQMEGVHIISYADKTHPVKLGFIKSWGCSEVAFKNGYLVVNNLNDLVFVDVRDLSNIREAARMANAFPQFYADQYLNNRPPVVGKYYVCPDVSKGEIVDWKLEKNVSGANCN
ncbi:MAG TPA: hypothetical protein VGM41_05300 [Chitinophagaceae bacterium]